MRFVPQLKRNLIFVGALKTLRLEESIKDGILKMTKGSMVVLKGVRRNNLYYLKGSTVINVTPTDSDNDSTRLWHMRLRHTGKKSLQALAKQNLLKVSSTRELKFCEHCVIGKKTKVRFGTATHAPRRFWIMLTQISGDLPRWHLLEVTTTL